MALYILIFSLSLFCRAVFTCITSFWLFCKFSVRRQSDNITGGAIKVGQRNAIIRTKGRLGRPAKCQLAAEISNETTMQRTESTVVVFATPYLFNKFLIKVAPPLHHDNFQKFNDWYQQRSSKTYRLSSLLNKCMN